MGTSGPSNSQLTRTLERVFEEAQLTGELKLNGRKLKDFPKYTAKYDLRDTVFADLSKNRFSELPHEVCSFVLLERLDCYNNVVRTVPSSVIALQSLTYLDLSRNQLTTIPGALCQLPIQVLVLSNNRLVSLPEEIGLLKCLMDLDVSCNELCLLPPGVGELQSLRSLRVRRNRLVEVPQELCVLRLWRLDLSANRLARLPPALRLMASLRELLLDCNPIVSPPAFLCKRGKVHVFKYLEMEAIKEDRKRGALLDSEFRSKSSRTNQAAPSGEFRYQNGHLSEMCRKRCTLDSGYNTSDGGGDRRWSQDTQELNSEPEEGRQLALRAAEATKEQRHERELQRNSSLSDSTLPPSSCGSACTPSTLSPGSEVNIEDVFAREMSKSLEEIEDMELQNGDHVDKEAVADKTPPSGYRWPPPPPPPMESSPRRGTQRTYPHIQTYREFKEALRQQRLGLVPASTASAASRGSLTDSTSLPSSGCSSPPVVCNVTPEEEFRARHEAIVQQQRVEAVLAQQRMEHQSVSRRGATNNTLLAREIPNQSKVEKPTRWETGGSPVGKSNGLTMSPERRGNHHTPPCTPCRPPDPHFTIRRGLEKAREEQELLEQLRWVIESRLKVSLPSDLGPSLMDGVVLCHLVNQVRPRSVASIHVPSPAVPKLTMAKCRRNVENFLTACRQLGVPEDVTCSAQDVLEERGLVRVAITVQELFEAASRR